MNDMNQKHRTALLLAALCLMALLGTFFQWFGASTYDKALAVIGYSASFSVVLTALVCGVHLILDRACRTSTSSVLCLHAPLFFLGNALWFMLADLSFVHLAQGDSTIPWVVLWSGMGTMVVGAVAHMISRRVAI